MQSSCSVDAIGIEAQTLRKVRARIIPFVFVLFVIAYIDRINTGFAALTMNKELAISSQQYGFVAGIFFFGYFIFEIPSNLLLHRIGARAGLADVYATWIPGMNRPRDLIPKAKEFALNALQLDNTLADPHSAPGSIELFYDWDWSQAEEQYKLTMALNPNNLWAHEWCTRIRGQIATVVSPPS